MINSIYDYDKDFLENKKIIIYGTLKKSHLLAMRLIQENIFFEGFFFPDICCELQNLMNKSVYTVKDIKNSNENVVILVPFVLKQEALAFIKKYPELAKCISYEAIKEQVINAENIIVYGCGIRAELLEKNVPDLNITCYLNSDEKKSGTIHKGKTIYHPSMLKDLKGSFIVIIANIYYPEIHKTLLEYGCSEDAIFIDLMDVIINEYEVSQIRMEHRAFCQFGKELYQKKVILYGERNIVGKVERIFSYIGIKFCNIICRESISEDGTIYNVFYQSNDKADIVLLTDRPNSLQYEILTKMNYPEEQILYLGTDDLFHSYRKSLLHVGLDPVLGHSKFSEEYKSLLFSKHIWLNDDTSKKQERPVRIVTLGGSTTDENGIKNKSWPEYLCEYLRSHNISYELYNGGTEGFNVSQELIKLIRDAVTLKPDICISYSGVNNIFKDTICLNDFPFIHIYQKEVYDSLKSHMNIFNGNIEYMEKADCIEWGIRYSGEWSDFWLSQIRMQKAICEEFSIKYISILQPNLYTKNYFMKKEQELLAWNNMWVENGILKFSDEISSKYWADNKKFQTSISDKIKELDYIYDMRAVFDGIDDVYLDEAHVFSFGNKIIAKKVYELLEHGHYLG